MKKSEREAPRHHSDTRISIEISRGRGQICNFQFRPFLNKMRLRTALRGLDGCMRPRRVVPCRPRVVARSDDRFGTAPLENET